MGRPYCQTLTNAGTRIAISNANAFLRLSGGFNMARADLNVRPLHDRILVRRMAEEEKTSGGIIIPDTAKEKPQRGEVVATGKGRIMEDGKTLPLEVRVGDKILFSKYSGTELKLDGTEYLMMREEDILGVFN
jgi:chaperonin GroES